MLYYIPIQNRIVWPDGKALLKWSTVSVTIAFIALIVRPKSSIAIRYDASMVYSPLHSCEFCLPIQNAVSRSKALALAERSTVTITVIFITLVVRAKCKVSNFNQFLNSCSNLTVLHTHSRSNSLTLRQDAFQTRHYCDCRCLSYPHWRIQMLGFYQRNFKISICGAGENRKYLPIENTISRAKLLALSSMISISIVLITLIVRTES